MKKVWHNPLKIAIKVSENKQEALQQDKVKEGSQKLSSRGVIEYWHKCQLSLDAI